MATQRRTVLRMAIGCVAAAAMSVSVGLLAQTFPDRPIKIIVPYAPGTTDQEARALALGLEKILKQPVVVENRPGAGGAVGANAVAKSPADGYTLMYASTAPLTIVPLTSDVPYKFEELVPVAQIMANPHLVAARADAPFKNLDELIAYGRANPGKINFGSTGTGSAVHLAGMAFAKQAGIQITHVPYQGLAPAITAARGGFVDFVVGLPIVILPQVDGGTMRSIVQLGATRSAALPNVPTAMERGIKVDLIANHAIFAPRGTPAPVLATLENAIRQTMETPEWRQFTQTNHEGPLFSTGAEMKRKLDAEREVMVGLVKEFAVAEK